MQDKTLPRRQEKITIETPYGTIESDSGNHLVDLATVFLIIVFGTNFTLPSKSK